MLLNQNQRDLLAILKSHADEADDADFATPFESLADEFSGSLVELQGVGYLAFVKTEDGLEKANAVRVTGEGWTALALVEATADMLGEFEIAEPEGGAIEDLKAKTIAGKDAQGNKVQLSALQVMSTQVRQAAVGILKKLDPEGYAGYKARKFQGCAPGERPSLEQSKAAYLWAFQRFLDVSYTQSGV